MSRNNDQNQLPIVWDTSGLLCLLATQRPESILASLGCTHFVPPYVLDREVLYIRPLPEDDPRGNLVTVNLNSLVESRFLNRVTPTAHEDERFVEFAQEVDDGEAQCLAIAVTRSWQLATDDRGAIGFLRRRSPTTSVVRTPDWLHHWTTTTDSAPEVLSEALRRVEICARYIPRRADPLYDWWQRHR